MLPGMDPRRARVPSGCKPAMRMLPACLALVAFVLPAFSAAQTVTMNRGGRDVRITVGDAAALPADFPGDVPLPPVHTVVRVDRSDGDMTVVVVAPGAVEVAAGRFRARMLAGGWTAAALVPPATGQGQAWVKGERAVLAWWTPADAGGVRLQLRLLATH